MKAIVFVGHGELPEAMKNSVQMIAGENKHLFSVSLEPDDGKDEYKNKLVELEVKLARYDSVLIFADLLGGSPSNAAVESYLNDEKVTIISGMNLPLVLTAVMAPDLPIEVLLSEGMVGIKNVKAELKGETRKPEIQNMIHAPEQKIKKTGSDKPCVIKNIRVDARGIHGQVATAWIPKFGVDRIIVIDDIAVKDEMQKMALKMAKPNAVKLSILSTKKAVEKLNDPDAYLNEEVLVIIQKIDTLKTLSALGFHFPEVNMGNVPNRPGTRSYRRTVSLTDEEVTTIKDLMKAGTHFTAQMVPSDSKVDFDEIINA